MIPDPIKAGSARITPPANLSSSAPGQSASGKSVSAGGGISSSAPTAKGPGLGSLINRFENIAKREVKTPTPISLGSLFPKSKESGAHMLERTKLMSLAEELGQDPAALSQTDSSLLQRLNSLCSTQANLETFKAFTEQVTSAREGLEGEISQLQARLDHCKATKQPFHVTRALQSDIAARTTQLKGLEKLLSHSNQVINDKAAGRSALTRSAGSITPASEAKPAPTVKPTLQRSKSLENLATPIELRPLPAPPTVAKIAAPRYDAIQGLSISGIDSGRGWTLGKIGGSSTLSADNYTKTLQSLGRIPDKKDVMPSAVLSIIKMADETTPKGQKILQLADTLKAHRAFIDDSLNQLGAARASFKNDGLSTAALDKQIGDLEAEKAGVDHLQAQVNNALVSFALRRGPNDKRFWNAKVLGQINDADMGRVLDRKAANGAPKLGANYQQYLKNERATLQQQAAAHPEQKPISLSISASPAPASISASAALTQSAINDFESLEASGALMSSNTLSESSRDLSTFFERATQKDIAALTASLTQNPSATETTLEKTPAIQPLTEVLAQSTLQVTHLEDASSYVETLGSTLTNAFLDIPEDAPSSDYYPALETAKAKGLDELINKGLVGERLDDAKETLVQVAPSEASRVDEALDALDHAVDNEATPVVIRQEMATLSACITNLSNKVTNQLSIETEIIEEAQTELFLQLSIETTEETVTETAAETKASSIPVPPPPPPPAPQAKTQITPQSTTPTTAQKPAGVADLMTSIRAKGGADALKKVDVQKETPTTPPSDELDPLASVLSARRKAIAENDDEEEDDSWDTDLEKAKKGSAKAATSAESANMYAASTAERATEAEAAALLAQEATDPLSAKEAAKEAAKLADRASRAAKEALTAAAEAAEYAQYAQKAADTAVGTPDEASVAQAAATAKTHAAEAKAAYARAARDAAAAKVAANTAEKTAEAISSRPNEATPVATATPSTPPNFTAGEIPIPPPPPPPAFGATTSSAKLKPLNPTEKPATPQASVIADDKQTALLDSIRQGKALKKVDKGSVAPAKTSTPNTGFNMEAIQGYIASRADTAATDIEDGDGWDD